jgi:hypothetical protein
MIREILEHGIISNSLAMGKVADFMEQGKLVAL